MGAGGLGFRLKNTAKDRFIVAMAAGRTQFSQEVGPTLLQNPEVPGQRNGAAAVAGRTPRECGILRVVAGGKPSQAIA